MNHRAKHLQPAHPQETILGEGMSIRHTGRLGVEGITQDDRKQVDIVKISR